MFSEFSRLRRLPRRLHHDVDSAALGIGVFDGDRDPFALFVNAKDDELAGLLFAGDARRFDDEPFDAGRKEFCVDDLEHGAPKAGRNDEIPY